MQNAESAGLLKAIKEVHINIVSARLDRTTSRLSVFFCSDEARERTETLLRISRLKYSVEPDGSLVIENANQLLLSREINLNGKGAELLIGPPRNV